MEGIQHNLDVRAVHLTDKGKAFRTGIHDVAFKAVENFHAENYSAVFSNDGQTFHIFDCPVQFLFLDHGKSRIERPIAI